ncbi:hypothetical protein R3W88_002856 [Solanum pinnatisectum]|uniref:PB1 domain-containing protein n=1 Tax=Solanum pinnatisectum TaxID=50273 RepID=A0AAV9MQ81_9SOLN|nr:hypothetical protein R3W88_002856 [Solanum pinnatisectum]
MGTEDKMLLCFCHWGRKTKMLPDGSILYAGGITDRFIVKTSINYNDFVKTVFDRLGIDPSDKMLHFTVKFDRSELIRLRDQEGVDTLLQFNDDFTHVYVSSLEEEPYSIPPSGGAKKVQLNVVSDSGGDTTPAGDDENDLESSLEKARFQSKNGNGTGTGTTGPGQTETGHHRPEPYWNRDGPEPIIPEKNMHTRPGPVTDRTGNRVPTAIFKKKLLKLKN